MMFGEMGFERRRCVERAIARRLAGSGEARIGYSWGTLGGLSLSYWTFDNDDSFSKTDTANYIYPTVFGGYAYNAKAMLALGVYPATQVDYSVDSSVKANTERRGMRFPSRSTSRRLRTAG